MESKIRSTVKYPTSIIVNGASNIGVELADSLLEQGGYVIIVDVSSEDKRSLLERVSDSSLLTFIDHSQLANLNDELRRLDYVFYLGHDHTDLTKEISTQQFLQHSNYLDGVLGLATKFSAKFLLTTSVKAHQLLLASKEIDMNYGAKSGQKHAVYSEMEIQRYAESLVVEYVNKVELDARVVRLGEVIGEGMDYVSGSPFTKMIIAAVSGGMLPVYKDGLSSEWYVHLLDAVYGLIKAQFSRSTGGQFFTLAYEDSVSDLSIAYKIHDFESDAGEIEFVADQKEDLPPLQLYKPAKSLISIGWKPKVELDEAIKQSLAGAKLFLAENTAAKIVGKLQGQKPKAKTSDKIKSFLNLAREVADNPVVEEAEGGVINKLLAERKKVDKIRTINISSAASKLRQRDHTAKRQSIFSRIGWGSFMWLRSRVSVVANMTPGQFLVTIALIVLAGFAYFYLLSPAAVLLRNYYLVNASVNRITTDQLGQSYRRSSSELAIINGATTESLKMVSRFSGIFNLLNLTDQYNSIITSLEIYQNYASGMLSISKSLEPLDEYLQKYENKVYFRPNSDSYLAVEQSSDYNDFLKLIAGNAELAKAGGDEMRLAYARSQKVDLSSLPAGVAGYFTEINKKLEQLLTFADIANLTQTFPALLGTNGAKTYLILLMDNSRYNASGGQVAGYVLLTLDKGAVTEVKAQSINAVNFDYSLLDSVYRQIANNNQFSGLPQSNFDYSMLGNIADFNDFAGSNKQIWEAILKRDLAAVVGINFTTLQALTAEAIKLTGETISIENVEFNGTNLLTGLKSLQSQPENLSRRNDVAAQLAALVTTKIFGKMNTNIGSIVNTLNQFYESKDIFVRAFDTELSKSWPLAALPSDKSDTYYELSLKSDSRIITPSKFPAISLASLVKVQSDLSLQIVTKVKFASLENIDEFGVCFPSSVVDVQVSSLSADKYRIGNVDNEKCLYVNVTDEQEVEFSYRTGPIATSGNSQYNLDIGVIKQSGVTVTADIEIQLDSSIKVINTTPAINLDANQKVFTENMVTDRYLRILVTK